MAGDTRLDTRSWRFNQGVVRLGYLELDGDAGCMEAEKRQTGASQNGVLAPTLTEPRADFIFYGPPFRIPPIHDRSTLLSTRQGAETPSTGGSSYLSPYGFTSYSGYEDR